MIAVDSSTWIAYLSGESGKDTDVLDQALSDGLVAMPPVVLTELLSDSKMTKSVQNLLTSVPGLPISDGFWKRSGLLRSKVLAKKRKAKLADTLIAQSCIDHDVRLITRDSDFKNFNAFGLKTLP